MKIIFTLIYFFFITIGVTAQHIKKYESKKGSPICSISRVSWLQGHWVGEAFGGPIEEFWSPPSGGSMMFAFKSTTVDGKVRFYEFGYIAEEEGSLVLRFKHYTAGLVGWEEKDKFMEYKLVEVTEDALYFDEFTFKRIADDKMVVFVVLNNNGKVQETSFEYTKSNAL